MKQERGPRGEQHMLHVEFGHFSNQRAFELFEQYAVRNADSLGMNEVEMHILLEAWKGSLTDVNAIESTAPTLDQVLSQTKELFDLAQAQDLPLSRVHLHPYGSFLMCYKREFWEDAENPIIKSSIAIPKYCIREPDGRTPSNWVD